MPNQAIADDQPASTSPVETNGTENNHSDQSVPGSQPESEGQESGGSGAESRIRRLAADKKRLSQEADYWKQVAQRYAQTDAQFVRQTPAQTPAPANQTPYPNDEVERAVQTLKSRGMVTKEELDQYLVRIEWDRIHDRNEADINRRGSTLPHYDREEVEEHARRKGISDPMAAYRDLYWDEILDANKRGEVPSSSSSGVTTVKPSKPQADNTRQPMDIEEFRQKLAGPDGKKFYEKLLANPTEFDAVMRTLSGQD